MAFMVLGQLLGSAIVPALCNVVFSASLKTKLAQEAPNVDPASVVYAGATEYRRQVRAEDLANVVIAYAGSIDNVFYLIAGVSAGCGLVVWGMGCHDLREKAHRPNDREKQP